MTDTVPDLHALAAVAGMAPHLAHAFASLACDLALVLDPDGFITLVAHSASAPLAAATQGWVGRSFVDCVTMETRHKVEGLRADLAAQGLARRRELNLPQGDGAPIPVAFSALRLGDTGPCIAAGHDLRSLAQMQQRFLRVQQELERGYGRALRAALRRARLADGEALPAEQDDWLLAPDPFPGPEGAEELDQASHAAFSAWLRAERMAQDGAPPAPPPAPPRRRRRR